MKTNIRQALGLIDPKFLKADEKFLCSIVYDCLPDVKVALYKKGNHIVVQSESWNPFGKSWSRNQKEFPLIALSWIVDRFENGFFQPQNQGGVSDFERSLSKEFDGELIGINAMAHCCAENLPGFNIWNASRKSYISDIPPQQWDIPRYMLLDQGLLAILKSLARDFEQGKL